MNPTLAWIIAALLAALTIYLVIYWDKKAKKEQRTKFKEDWNRREINRKLEPDWDVTDRIYHQDIKETARNRQLV